MDSSQFTSTPSVNPPSSWAPTNFGPPASYASAFGDPHPPNSTAYPSMRSVMDPEDREYKKNKTSFIGSQYTGNSVSGSAQDMKRKIPLARVCLEDDELEPPPDGWVPTVYTPTKKGKPPQSDNGGSFAALTCFRK